MNTYRATLGVVFLVSALASAVTLLECGDRNPGTPDGGSDASSPSLDAALEAGDGAGDAGAPGDAGTDGGGCPHARYIAYDPTWASSRCPSTFTSDAGTWTGSILFSLEEADGGSLAPDDAGGAWDALPP